MCVFENFIVDTEIEGQPIELALWWASGMEENERLRPLSYDKADVVLISFAIDDPQSFENVTTIVKLLALLDVNFIVVPGSTALL